MKYQIEYSTLVNAKELRHIPHADLLRIKKAIEAKLGTQPDLFGKPLRRSLKGHWSLRVGEYRVIYRIEKAIVKIFVIAHRSVVYEELK